MKEVISYHDFLVRFGHRFTGKGYDADGPSRWVVKKYLEKNKSLFKIAEIYETKKKNSVDLIIYTTEGRGIAIEIKDRQCPSDYYGDHVVEYNKIKGIRRQINNGLYQRAHLISLFEDGVMVMTGDIQVMRPDAWVTQDLCNEQTLVDPLHRDKKLKYLVHYPHHIKYYFGVILDEQGEYSDIYYSNVPFNLKDATRDINSNPLF